MRPTLIGFAVVLCVAVHAQVALGQSDSLSAAVSHDSVALAAVLAGLQSEERIRVEVPRNLLDPANPHVLTPRDRVELFQPRVAGDVIAYSQALFPKWARGATESFPRPLPISQVFSVEARRNNAAGGAVLGAALVGAAALVIRSDPCDEIAETQCIQTGETVAAALIGAAAGALIGGLIGKRTDRWKTVYQVGPQRSARR